MSGVWLAHAVEQLSFVSQKKGERLMETSFWTPVEVSLSEDSKEHKKIGSIH